MRRAVLAPGAAILLVGPTALAYFAGGYFDEPRLVAALVAWALVLVTAFASPRPLPISGPGRAALGGLALILVWTGASLAWAPLASPATDSLVRLLLYVGALIAAIGILRDRGATRAVEPLLALGTVAVIGYGLAGRLLAGIVELSRSAKAGGRLEQPITYWNAEGALAAIGMVLCARLAGDGSRPTIVRALAAAASAPLGLGVYLSYSRGALAAAAVGLIVLLATAPSWSQLRAAGAALAAGLLAAACSAAFPAVSSLEGARGERESEGVTMLAILITVMLAAGLVQAWIATAEARGRMRVGAVGVARRLPVVAAVAVALTLAGLVVGGLGERSGSDRLSERHGLSRLGSVSSRRYEYWRVGAEAFAENPLRGLGAGGFRVFWLRERPVHEGVLEVHSLPLEMASELGIPGLLGLGLLLGGTGAAARRAVRRRSDVAAGAVAAGTVWVLHAAIDWDWQVPAVTLVALVLAGALIAASEADPEPDRGRRSPPRRSRLRGRAGAPA
jgi:O-Antigen ligase